VVTYSPRNDPDAPERPPRIIPTFRYDDPRAAIAFLKDAFGFEEHEVYEQDGVVAHAELKLGESYIMLGAQRDDDYGSREYAAKDPGGNVWSFGTYLPS
jgi:uncharacterized glyoxalase superfamily protein PhnB